MVSCISLFSSLLAFYISYLRLLITTVYYDARLSDHRVCCVFVFFFFEFILLFSFFFFQAEDGIRDLVRSRGLGDVYKRQVGRYPDPFDEDGD